MPERNKLRFAVLVDGKLLKKWQADSIQLLAAENHSELVGFIQNRTTSKSKHSVSVGFKSIYKNIDHSGPLQLVEWDKTFSSPKIYHFSPEQKGISNYLLKEDLETLASLQLDFILRFGFGILKGEVLDIPKFGVWSFHHGNPRKYRGGPAGFWEIFNGDDITGSILQQLNEKLDQGLIIKEGFFKTIDHSYKANLFHVLQETASWPSIAVKSIVYNNQEQLQLKSVEEKGKLYKVPSNWTVLRFLYKVLSNKISFHMHRLFKAEKWNVGRVNQSIEELVTTPIAPIKWLNEAPKNTYYADPFGWNNKEILLELFDYKTSKGSLKVLDTNSGKISNLLENQTHYSYPFSIIESGKKYILPENYKSDQLKLYEVDDNLKVLETHKLLNGPWIDPTLFKKDEKWWLSCMHQSSPKENLYLFYAEKVEGPYLPHALNPVLTDILSARPAGTPFMVNKKIIRPTQNCARTYGGSVVLKQIEKLSPTEFEEHVIKEILPQKGRFSEGLHTVSANGSEILVDGKRYHFNFWNFLNQLKASINKGKN